MCVCMCVCACVHARVCVCVCVHSLSGVCGLSSSVQRQFHVVKEQKNWTEAQQYCREKFTDLATIDDMAEMERLKRAIHEEHVEEAWIGLKRGSSYKWQWSLADRDFYGENEAEFRNWHRNEPQETDGEDCAAIVAAWEEWIDHFCGNAPSRYPFICYDSEKPSSLITNLTHPLTWRDAQRYCREKHTDLASVRNQRENDQIVAFTAPANSFVWIGLFRDTWEWSDGSSSSFRHWASVEPKNVDPKEHGLCAEIWPSGQWNDEGCDKLKNFICYEAPRVKRTEIVRVKLQVASHVDLDDPDVQAAFLQQIGQRLRSKGLPANAKLTWRKQSDGKVFHKEKNGKKKKRDEL
ncbi:hypothetical protein ACEWY4_017032 [Coilia grayii]|uniref:C-type lectin domain-containing protein n=1 Tax=Coilia grayii TaxID=363190 RepID=A0ABD1JM26_9TELE